MNKKYLLLLSIIIFIFSCKEQATLEGNKLLFGQNSCYLLEESEFYQEVIDSTLLKKYDIFYNFNDIQMPVNRVIIRSKDTLFIAISTSESSVKRLQNAHQEEKTHQIISQKQQNNAIAYFLKKDNFFNYRYMYKDEDSQLIFLLNYISSDSLHIQQLYNHDSYVKEKITCKF